MSNIDKLLEGDILKRRSDGVEYKYDKEFDGFRFHVGNDIWSATKYKLSEINQWDMQEVEPEPKTYKTDNIEFTVKETEENYELQFPKFPDKLRGIGKIGEIENKSVYTNYVKDITIIPKTDISKDFFSKLLDLLENKLKEVKDIKDGFSRVRQDQIRSDCYKKSACKSEYKKLKRAYDSKNYNDFIKVLKDNIDWCRDNDILFASEIRYVENYKPKTKYLTYEELIEIAGERYEDLVFDYNNEKYIHDYITVSSCIWFRSNGRNSLELPMLISYVQIGLAKVRLK